MKRTKVSDAILKGYKANGGKQCVDAVLDRSGRMCVLGAYRKGAGGSPMSWQDDAVWDRAARKFVEAWGINPITLNNNYEERGTKAEPFPWEHIYGMARAAGL